MDKKEYVRTIRIPIHYETTKSKLDKLDKITSRLTYCTKLFSDKIKETKSITRKELVNYEKETQKITKLNSAYVQQCKDKAIWMWRSYDKQHKKWKYKLERAKNNLRYYNKLLKREPSEPFSKSNNKVPVRLDYRTINLKSNLELNGRLANNLKEENKLSELWVNLTSLKKNNKLMIPLNPADYHLNKLKQADKISDCELIKKNNKWHVYVICQYNVPLQQINSVRAIDLGISRSITTVLLSLSSKESLGKEPGKELNKNSFLVIREGKKKQKIEQYDKLITKLQEQQNWKLLKRTRQKRKNFIEDQERKLAEQIADISGNSILGIGYPKEIKYTNYKGNGKKQIRKRLHKWSYSRIINYIIQSCEEKGIEAIKINEYNTSKTCNKCNSKDTQRPYQDNWSLFHCNNCEITLNADINASINLMRRLGERQVSFNQLASDEHARIVNDYHQNGMSTKTQTKALLLDAQGFSPE